MIDINRIKNNLKADNHNKYHNLLIQASIHSDSHEDLLKAIEDIQKQMASMYKIIIYLIKDKENNNE